MNFKIIFQLYLGKEQMPSLTKRERVIAIIRYIHNESDDLRHTADTLSHALQIPSASVRRTVYQDYPESFITSRAEGIRLSHLMPTGVPTFDLEPVIAEKYAKFNGQYLVPGIDKILQPEYAQLLIGWITNNDGMIPLSLRKETPKEWWDLYNAANTLLVVLRLLKSRVPERRLGELVINEEKVPEFYKMMVQQLAKRVSSK